MWMESKNEFRVFSTWLQGAKRYLTSDEGVNIMKSKQSRRFLYVNPFQRINSKSQQRLRDNVFMIFRFPLALLRIITFRFLILPFNIHDHNDISNEQEQSSLLMHVPSDKLIQFTEGVHEKYVRAENKYQQHWHDIGGEAKTTPKREQTRKKDIDLCFMGKRDWNGEIARVFDFRWYPFWASFDFDVVAFDRSGSSFHIPFQPNWYGARNC